MKKAHIYALHAVMSIGLIALMVVASFYDYRISNVLYTGGAFPKIGAILGKLPAWIIFVFASSVLFKFSKEREKREMSRIPLMAVYGALNLGGCFMFCYSIMDEIAVNSLPKYLVICILTICFTVISLLVADKISMDNIVRMRKWAFAAIFLVGIVFLATTFMKIVWGRVRYEDILAGNGAFTPWYILNGYTGNMSMPSGHVALASCSFMAVPLFMCLPNLKIAARGMFLLSFLFIAVIAISRIMGGNHFLSDVTMSVIVCYLATTAVCHIGFGKTYSNYSLSEKSLFNKL